MGGGSDPNKDQKRILSRKRDVKQSKNHKHYGYFYNKTLRTSNPSDKNTEKKWYPVAKSISPVTEKEVTKIIADETTLNSKEAEMAIAQVRKAIFILLKAGRTVKLGDWATSRLPCVRGCRHGV